MLKINKEEFDRVYKDFWETWEAITRRDEE